MKPTLEEIRELEEWLSTLPRSAAIRAALGAVLATVKRLEAGHSDLELTATQIADEAEHGSFNDAEKARRWLKQIRFPELLTTWHSRQADWLRMRRPDATSLLIIEVRESRGGRGNQKTFEIVRRLLSELLPRSESATDHKSEIDGTGLPLASVLATGGDADHGDSFTACIRYDMALCGPSELTWFGRMAYGDGRFGRGSWRWRIHAANFVANGLVALLLFIGCVILPLAGVIRLSWATLLGAAFTIVLIYWQTLRPWVRTVDDRIRMADESMLKSTEPAQLEIWRNGTQSEWRLVRYTGTCTVCGSPICVQPGEPDFPRRLVGRCSESPREHVFSFDRITRLGKALITP